MNIDAMPCITCQKSLREYGKITPDLQWAYCTICGARYEIIPALDEYGQPHLAPDGKQMFYLNPVAPGSVARYHNSDDDESLPQDFQKLKAVIDKSETVTDFLKAVKKI